MSAQTTSPSTADLEGAEQLLEESEPEDKRPTESPSPHLFQLRWTTLVTASGGLPHTSLTLDDLGFRTEDLLSPAPDELHPSTAVAAYGELAPLDWLLFRALFDTREIRDGATLSPPVDGVAMNGNTAEDELGSGAALRELSAVMGEETITFEIGRFQADVAEGLVYQDYGGGLRVRMDFEPVGMGPFDAELLITTVGQRIEELEQNQVLALRFDWNLSPFEHVGLFVAASEDQNGEISDALRSAYAEQLTDDQRGLTSLFLQEDGSGRQGYLGLLVQWIAPSSATLRARLALSGGKLKLRVPLAAEQAELDPLASEEIEVDARGLAADIELRYPVSRGFDVSAYGVLMSGDAPPSADGERYESFIALAPYWTYTGLFFSGGLGAGLYPTRATTAGVLGRGVVAAGTGVELSSDTLSGEARAMVLASHVDPPAPPLGGTSRLYGIELDLLGEFQPTSFFGLGAELDVLIPGGFFRERRLAYLAIVRVTVSHGE